MLSCIKNNNWKQTMYYRIQFPPYEPFKKNYLKYRAKTGFMLSGFAAASIFNDKSLCDEGLKKYLNDKEYILIKTDESIDISGIFVFRGT